MTHRAKSAGRILGKLLLSYKRDRYQRCPFPLIPAQQVSVILGAAAAILLPEATHGIGGGVAGSS